MNMSEHSCKLMHYKYFSADELYVALGHLNWFAEEAMSGKTQFDSKTLKWNIDPNLQLPSWKHLTRGGHANGANIGRGGVGVRCRSHSGNKDIASQLIFRRHSRDKRIFVVQRIEDLDLSVTETNDILRGGCLCKRCFENQSVKSKLTMDDFQLYKEL